MELSRDRGRRARGQGQTATLEVAWETGAWRQLRLDQHRKLYLLLPQTDLHRTFSLTVLEHGTEAAVGPSPSRCKMAPVCSSFIQSVPASGDSICSSSLDSACIVPLAGLARIKSPLSSLFSYKGSLLDLGCLGHLETLSPQDVRSFIPAVGSDEVTLTGHFSTQRT